MNHTQHNKQTGFTLIELLVGIALGAIILSIGIPSFSSFIKNGRVTTNTNSLVADINYARSEAVTRGELVILCRSANPTAASPTCGGSNNNWSTGWLIFVSGDANTTFDAGTDTLLRASSAAQGTVTVKSNDVSNSHLKYKADGTIDMGGGTAVFAVCDERGENYGNQLLVSPSGRPRLITPVPSACNAPAV